VLTGRRYRVVFTPEQAALAEETGAACRTVWNTALEQRREYRRRDAWVGYRQQARELAEAKAEHEWLEHAPSHCLQQTPMDLDRACREHGTFRVRWRSSRRWSPSFRFPDPKQITVQRLGRRWGRVKLPKLGWVRFRWSRPLGGTVRSATVSRDGEYWYVSFLVEDGRVSPDQHACASAVGVDRGVAVALACSDGGMYDRAFSTAGEQKRCRKLQRRLAGQNKTGANRKRTLAALRVLKRRERERRGDFAAQVANRLATGHGIVVLEELNTRAMTASAEGTIAEPGRRVAQKAGLNRAILAKGWYRFELALRNAARYTGTRIVKVPAAYTSLTCSRCLHVDPESRESQARFRCTSCGHCENAAKNILAAGLAVTACGDLAVGRSVKQEPPTVKVGISRLQP